MPIVFKVGEVINRKEGYTALIFNWRGVASFSSVSVQTAEGAADRLLVFTSEC